MKIKTLLISAMLSTAALTAVSAQGEFVKISYPNDDSVLLISGNVGKKENVSVRVLALGEDGNEFIEDGNLLIDLTASDVRDNPGIVDYFDVVSSNENGEYSFKYKTQGESGYYIFTVTDADGRQQNEVYEYYSPEYAAEKIELLNSYIEKNEIDNINQFIKRYTKPLAADNDYYLKIENESYASELGDIVAEGGKVADKADLKQRMRIATARVCLKHFEVSEFESMLEAFKEFGLSGDSLYTKSLKETVLDDVKTKILNDFKTIDAKNDTDIKKQIDDKILLGAVNYSAWGKIMTILNDNISVFKTDIQSEYNSLNDAKKAEVAKNIAQKVKSSSYDTVADLEKDLEKAIAAQKKSSSGSSSGSSGGSGGSGSSSGKNSGSSIPAISVGTTNKIDNTQKKSFDDLINAEWAREAVESLAEKNIVSGKSENEFAPNDSITREEFLAIVVRAFELIDENAKCNFEDVPEGAWYYSTVASAYQAGITKGISDTMFGTGENITREDMCVLVYKAAEIAGITFDEGELDFTDADEISDYAKRYVAILSSAGIVNGVGDGKFAPKDNATRASAARIIYEILKNK